MLGALRQHRGAFNDSQLRLRQTLPFFDRRADRVLMIDPRGSFGVPGSTGDPAYDFGKLAHSLLGGYDFFVSDLFDVSIDLGAVSLNVFGGPSVEMARQLARQVLHERAALFGLSLTEVRLVEASCFLSLLPLHADRPGRQLALAATGLSLVSRLTSEPTVTEVAR